MDTAAQKPATAARIYDYFLGGVHNFPADREAARKVLEQFPQIRVGARANRAFLGRAVRYLAGSGVRQFLDIGSGIPTEGNVHEIAQGIAPDARVVYVDMDPVAVSESLELLDGNPYATAIRADMRDPRAVLDHPNVRQVIDFDRPVALLMAAVLHFLQSDDEAQSLVDTFLGALAPGSYLLASHAGTEAFQGDMGYAQDVYRRQTTTPGKTRSRDEVERFFAGLEPVEPGVVWVAEWHPDPDADDPLVDEPRHSATWGGVARKI